MSEKSRTVTKMGKKSLPFTCPTYNRLILITSLLRSQLKDGALESLTTTVDMSTVKDVKTMEALAVTIKMIVGDEPEDSTKVTTSSKTIAKSVDAVTVSIASEKLRF